MEQIGAQIVVNTNLCGGRSEVLSELGLKGTQWTTLFFVWRSHWMLSQVSVLKIILMEDPELSRIKTTIQYLKQYIKLKLVLKLGKADY